LISNNLGLLEYWSVGVMTQGLISFCNTPMLHHSSPGLSLSRPFNLYQSP
jgi:hypothetical protein